MDRQNYLGDYVGARNATTRMPGLDLDANAVEAASLIGIAQCYREVVRRGAAHLPRKVSGAHELFDGEIYAMAGGSEDHSALAVNVLAALLGAVGDRPCRVHTSDLRIYVEAAGLATFPDGSVICGPLQQHAPSPDATALNPLVLLEVTRPAAGMRGPVVLNEHSMCRAALTPGSEWSSSGRRDRSRG